MPLTQLPLFQELKARADAGDHVALYLHGVLVTSFGDVQRLLGDVRVYFRHFTDHSVDHSLRIARNIGKVLSPAQYKRTPGNADCISSADIFLLIAGALIHDIGMVIAEGEVAALEKDPGFREFLARTAEPGAAANDDDWTRRGIPRLALAEFVRRRHPQRSMQMVVDGKLPEKLTQGRLGYWLGKVAAAHGLEFEAVCDSRNYPTHVEVQISGPLQEECNPRFAALCLRLGDLLDVGTARACPMLRALSEPLAATSADHWKQYESIEVQGLAPNTQISIAGTCPSQESERLLREWVAWLEREAAEATLMQNQDAPRYRLQLGRVKYNVEPRKDANGVPKYEFLSLRFNLDERMVFERLFGKSLYGRPELALRELIQNAIDAQRARHVADLAASPEWNAAVPDLVSHRTKLLRDRIGAVRATSPITIDVAERDDGGERRTWIGIRDCGIGMTREAVDKYLLKVGRSRWSADPAVSRLGLGSVTAGAFGIGFISALMVADRIIVETRSCLPNEPGIRLTIYGWQGYAATEPWASDAPGTTVWLRMADRFVSSPEELAAMVGKLVPLPDFPIRVVSNEYSCDVPQINLRDLRDRDAQCVVPIDECGSIVRIRSEGTGRRPGAWRGSPGVVRLLVAQPPRIRVCQDGITIPEMALPASDDPEIAELEARDCLVDLRGSSRVPLDLSRNLVEGGNEAFWKKAVPMIWDAISARTHIESVALRAVGALATRAVHVKEARDPLVFAAPRGRLIRGRRALEATDIVCIDPFWSYATEAMKREDAVAWITPDTALKEAAAEFRMEAPMLDLVGGDEEYASMDEVEEDASSPLRASEVVDREWRELAAQYAWIAPATAVPSRLFRVRSTSALHVQQVLGFLPSWQWFSIQSPWAGEHTLVPFSTVDTAVRVAKQRELSLADFYVFLLEALFRAQYDDWGHRGPLAEQVSRAAGLLELRRRNRSGRADRYELDDSASLGDPRPEFDEWLSAEADLYEGIAAESGLENAVAPWDAEAWDEDRYGRPPRL